VSAGAQDRGGVRAAEVVREALTQMQLAYEERSPGSFVVALPGEHKLATTCSLVVGAHRLTVRAFVIRRPDEDVPDVHRWLLERNLRGAGVSFAVDQLGDVYLTGSLPHAAVTAEEVDQLLGSVLQQADESFDVLLELGFAAAIRREWAWREARGESSANLRAFRHLAAPADDA